jgi:hypothetical protein
MSIIKVNPILFNNLNQSEIELVKNDLRVMGFLCESESIEICDNARIINPRIAKDIHDEISTLKLEDNPCFCKRELLSIFEIIEEFIDTGINRANLGRGNAIYYLGLTIIENEFRQITSSDCDPDKGCLILEIGTADDIIEESNRKNVIFLSETNQSNNEHSIKDAELEAELAELEAELNGIPSKAASFTPPPSMGKRIGKGLFNFGVSIIKNLPDAIDKAVERQANKNNK